MSYRFGGKKRLLSFGCYTDKTTSLDEAREKRTKVKQCRSATSSIPVTNFAN